MTPEFKDHFSERAAGYAAYRPRYPAALAEALAALAPARGLAWDAGCGSGQFSTLLGDRFDRVFATDASSAQVALAVPHSNVEYRVERAEQCSLGHGSVDLITVAQAAHWLDLPAFYREAQRVARPGAAIALIAYERTSIDPPIDEIVEDFYSRVLGRWWPPERKHIETGYRHLDFPFAATTVPDLGIEELWTADEFLGYIRTWSAVRAMEESEGPGPTQDFEARLRSVWGERSRRIFWPIVVRAGHVR